MLAVSVSPEVTANLIEVVEISSQNLTHIAAPRLRMGAGKPWRRDVRIAQKIETRIKQMEGQPASRLQMASNGLQRFPLQIDS